MSAHGDARGQAGALGAQGAVDRAVRVVVPGAFAELAGALLMDWLGPFELEAGVALGAGVVVSGGGASSGAAPAAEVVALVFYPPADAFPSADEVFAALPCEVTAAGGVRVEVREVARDWVEGWRDHFRPIVIDEVRIRPPWEPPLERGGGDEGDDGGESAGLVDVVINPGLGFGTGLHPTTRGTLHLLQNPGNLDGTGEGLLGPLVDAGTGSGILAIAAAKLGWGPVFAFDNDPVALVSARENVEANGVAGVVEVHQTDIAGASAFWLAGATVLANMTLEPVLALIKRLAPREDSWSMLGAPSSGPERVVVSGILEGAQEREVQGAARLAGFTVGRRLQEDEWVSLELLPVNRPGCSGDWPPGGFGS